MLMVVILFTVLLARVGLSVWEVPSTRWSERRLVQMEVFSTKSLDYRVWYDQGVNLENSSRIVQEENIEEGRELLTIIDIESC